MITKDNLSMSDRIRHFFHVVSEIRPIVWICSYLVLIPIFALIYWALPDAQFRIPSNSSTDYASWLYYSIVTISTLGFGDYTPAHLWAQLVTACEVMCGLIILGLFLNAVGSMKSEIDVASEVEKQRIRHQAAEKQKLLAFVPAIIHNINTFLAYCYAVTTPVDKRRDNMMSYNPKFGFSDMQDMFKPSGLPSDHTMVPAVARLMKSATKTSLTLDSLQNRIDLSLWPKLLEDCFAFVANYQMFTSEDVLTKSPEQLVNIDGISRDDVHTRISDQIANWKGEPQKALTGDLNPVAELYYFIKENAELARRLEVTVTEIASDNNNLI